MSMGLSNLQLEILKIIENWDDIWRTYKELANSLNSLGLEVSLKEVRRAVQKLKAQDYLYLGALTREDQAGYFGRGYFLTGLGRRSVIL